MDRPSAPVVVLVSLLIAICSQAFRTYARLKHVPGPFWAKFTNWQRVLWVKSMRSHDIYQSIHEKYGEFVRIGPNAVSISDPAAIPEIYPMRAGFPKVRRAPASKLCKKKFPKYPNWKRAYTQIVAEQVLQCLHAVHEERDVAGSVHHTG
jgi:hypothetical protein